MLIKRAVLDRIARGEVDLAFRKWKRATVKAGGTLRTAVGMLDILAVDAVEVDQITAAEAERAGFDELKGLHAALAARSEGRVHRIELRPGGPDPRVAFREDGDLGEEQLAAVVSRLDRMDRTSQRGVWTRAVLDLIAEHPHVRAPDLAASLGWETAPFKANVRKLKDLGLTISHSPGYELSPRGRAVLSHFEGS